MSNYKWFEIRTPSYPSTSEMHAKLTQLNTKYWATWIESNYVYAVVNTTYEQSEADIKKTLYEFDIGFIIQGHKDIKFGQMGSATNARHYNSSYMSSTQNGK